MNVPNQADRMIAKGYDLGNSIVRHARLGVIKNGTPDYTLRSWWSLTSRTGGLWFVGDRG